MLAARRVVLAARLPAGAVRHSSTLMTNVKKLRADTGAGFADCKKALVDHGASLITRLETATPAA